MKKEATIIAVVNQKGGTAKTTTVENLGIGLSKQGKKVLLIDADPQASLTISLGYPQPDDLELTLSDLLNGTISENPVALDEVLIHQQEGIDLIPSNISLAGLEVSLVNTMNRERILKQFLETLREDYDYILLDCMPSLGMLTVNALAAADATLVPVQANYLSAKGLEQLLATISQVKRQINPKLCIEGILITMVEARTNYAKDIQDISLSHIAGRKDGRSLTTKVGIFNRLPRSRWNSYHYRQSGCSNNCPVGCRLVVYPVVNLVVGSIFLKPLYLLYFLGGIYSSDNESNGIFKKK